MKASSQLGELKAFTDCASQWSFKSKQEFNAVKLALPFKRAYISISIIFLNFQKNEGRKKIKKVKKEWKG